MIDVDTKPLKSIRFPVSLDSTVGTRSDEVPFTNGNHRQNIRMQDWIGMGRPVSLLVELTPHDTRPLVERLRSHPLENLNDVAADEIERLRGEIDRANLDVGRTIERERVRTILEWVACEGKHHAGAMAAFAQQILDEWRDENLEPKQ